MLKKWKKMESFELQALREVVKENAENVVERFEEKFKEIQIQGKRKSHKTSTIFPNALPKKYYTEAEH